ncbi:MAG: hypothetical protein PF574_00925 [Candidatus Delongbacteria bacterium]|jgi:hypothetical protein|nr:hypothetical protein [Candidatus Delongbacteria bacterium]
MKKLIAFALVALFVIIANAQLENGMSLRTRSEMYNMTDSDGNPSIYYDSQPWQRLTDIRFKPWISYRKNKHLSATAVFEIGDIQFGVDGGALETDGINIETKNIYLDISPDKNNNIILGLQPYRDFHKVILDTDLAGISWSNVFQTKYKSKLAWFVPVDDDEGILDGTTYSFGKSLLIADFDYTIDKNINVGFNSLSEVVREEIDNASIHETSINLWFAPYFSGTFNNFHLEAVIAGNNKRPDEKFGAETLGLLFSLKTNYKIDKKTTARFNFLFRDGDNSAEGGYDTYKSYQDMSYYQTGLEILTEGGCGMDRTDYNVFSPISSFHEVGIILPSIFFDYKLNKDVILTFGAGHATTPVEYLQVHWDGITRPESWIGTEVDFKANINLYEKVSLLPYLAVMLPGEWYDFTGKADLFLKVGMTLKTKL